MSVFDTLVGQSSALDAIRRAAQASRHESAASPSQSPASTSSASGASAMTHAWLFTGPPGSGRSLAAKILAASLECTGAEPGCGECPSCKAVMGENHPDVTFVRTDRLTITIDNVRSYVAQSFLAPSEGRYRIFIVEDADRMLSSTSNVLLKAIEEPGPRTVWMLCTTSAADMLPTIRSRTRHINLVTPSVDEVTRLLVESEGVDLQRASVAAQAAQSHIGVARALATDPSAGALRDKTLRALVQITGVGDAVLAAGMLLDAHEMYAVDGGDDAPSEAIDAAAALESEQRTRMEAMGLDPSAAQGRSKLAQSMKAQVKADAQAARRRQTRMQRDMIDRELIYLMGFFRDVLMLQLGAEVPLINPDYAAEIEQRAQAQSAEQTLAHMDALAKARERLAANVSAQLAVEAALVAVRPVN